jgi:hypothetical protein
MAKKQTRRSISVSRSTYERLKAFCETSGISMSQFVEGRVGDFLGRSARPEPTVTPSAPAAGTGVPSVAARPEARPTIVARPAAAPAPAISKPSPAAPKATAESIFTF